jgi:prepilin-type N-terminal cleavage/methylation domain-containing protein
MHARRGRSGYTLLEVLIVCAILAILATLTYPSLRGMYPYYKLQGGADAVRAAWAHARARAIEEGRPYRFSIDDLGSHFRIAPDREDYWAGGSRPEGDPAGHGLILEQALPAGVRMGANGAAPVMDGADADRENTPSSGNWTTTAIFLPDGTAKQDVHMLMQIKGARANQLHLRGLTGTVLVQRVTP